jgi:16S rRNA (cytosine1402-N4)-methyltransferase
VLFAESIENLNIKPDGIYVDCTLGGGWHASGICAELGRLGTLIGVDRDVDALDAARINLEKYQCRKLFVRDNYSNIKEILRQLEVDKIDGALLDLGVSSFQLDNEGRGFSYMRSAPLDMRMNADDDLTAEDVVNQYSQKALTDIIRKYGEEKWAARISDFIVKARAE